LNAVYVPVRPSDCDVPVFCQNDASVNMADRLPDWRGAS